MLNRRGLITGLVSLVAAPAIVRVSSLMPVKNMIEPEILLEGFIREIYLGSDRLFWIGSNRAMYYFDGSADFPFKSVNIADEDLYV